MRELPTEPGSVIGWTTYYDGEHYGSATLSWADEGMADDLVWYRAGFDEPLGPDAMRELIRDHWQLLGVINLCPFVYPEHCSNHARHAPKEPGLAVSPTG